MSFRVKDELEIAIFINDVEYPLEAVNALQFFHASSFRENSQFVYLIIACFLRCCLC